mgnify:FL=1
MADGNWNSKTGAAISIDSNGVLRDGQHRLKAVIESEVPIYFWVCTGVDPKGIYDQNRPRTAKDQVKIIGGSSDWKITGNQMLSAIKIVIQKGKTYKVSACQLIDFIELHKREVEAVAEITSKKYVKTLTTSPLLSTYLLILLNDFSMLSKLEKFDSVLRTGFQTDQDQNSIIAFRNAILNNSDRFKNGGSGRLEYVRRCMYAFDRYVKNKNVKTNIDPKTYIWGFDYDKHGLNQEEA